MLSVSLVSEKDAMKNLLRHLQVTDPQFLQRRFAILDEPSKTNHLRDSGLIREVERIKRMDGDRVIWEYTARGWDLANLCLL